MDKLTLKQRNALKATLMRVAALHPAGVLMCGFDAINERAFCKLIKLGHNLESLLTCTRIDITEIKHIIIRKMKNFLFSKEGAKYLLLLLLIEILIFKIIELWLNK